MGVELGVSEVITFSEGNIFVRVRETVRDKDVYLVQPIAMRPNDEFVEVLFWIDAFKRASANSVTAIIPYFSYAKADKKDEPRVSIRARVCADAIESAGVDRVVTMDLHSPQVQGFFKKPVDHLLAMPVLCEYIKKLDLGDFVVVSPDSGFAKHTRKYGSYLGVSVAIGDKMRKGHDETVEFLDIIGDVKGKNAIIIDDFSISGGTLIEVAKGLKQRGAKRIFACLSHILLNKEGVARIEDSPIELVISTDSVDNQWIKGSQKIKIVSVAPLFGEAIMRIHKRVSVSPLFDTVPERVLDEAYLHL
jgi:ribose-phosphate pyrophosphokinase